ncbi:fatty acid desaturase family protein [Flexithrix dorotheae]|uniref:fatty acid desaturase family protein n=1 Tax=Flexithrix dorotheae TaxID=70993 RepID=UPI000378CE13|nr:acyl-CoA desaturase [Flexithrix dorotheae]
MEQHLKFTGRDESGFFRELRKRVDAYFRENNISKNGNGEMVFKSFFFLGGVILLYSLIISNIFSPWIMLGLAALLGIFKAFVGFNVSHDAIHGSYSKNKRVNKIISVLAFNTLGGNDYMWSITHNVVHHTFTNIPGHDEDIDVAPGMIRLSPEEKLKPIMKYQHIYAFPLYGLAYISWVFRKDFVKFFQDKIGQKDNRYHKPVEYFNLFFFKAVYYTLFIVIPLMVLDITWWQFIIGFVTMQLFAGLVLGLVFQLAHVVEGPEFPYPNEKGAIEDSWALHQMKTTANFARKDWLANFLCGGLNFQIEHHLFPHICHVHYKPISSIVKATAEEFQVPYHESPTFLKAIGSHYRMLKKFGRGELALNVQGS